VRKADHLRIRTFGRGRRIAVALTVALALLASACGGDDGESADGGGASTGGGVFRLGIGEPTSIDPYNSGDSESQMITKNLFAGLVDIDDETRELVPLVAESWSRNDDCTVWTFDLREGTTFTNGEAVTAQSFVDGLNRAVRQDAASDIAYHAAVIEGFEAVNGSFDEEGEILPATATELSGVTAVDAQTLVFTLSVPECEFDKRTLQPLFSPVPTTAGTFDNQEFNDNPIGNGPFMMKEPWQHDQSITLVRNDDYFGDKAFLDEVQFTIETVEDEYKNFQAGDRDWARVPPELTAQAQSTYEPDGSFLSFVSFGLEFLLVNDVNPPLDDPDARKAISAAIDRQEIIDGVFKAPLVKADSIIPPSLGEYYEAGSCEACEFDVDRARQWAEDAGLTPGTTVSLAYNEDGGHKVSVEAMAAQIEENLGIEVDLQPVAKFRDMIGKTLDPAASGLFRFAWGADYPTPSSFLAPLLLSTSGDNLSGYANPAFDEQIELASAAQDDAARKAPILEAQRIALDDMALIPLWYRTQFRVWNSDKWTGVAADFFENPTLADIKAK
jgi:oligopeptide transport system substrate-binding protein